MKTGRKTMGKTAMNDFDTVCTALADGAERLSELKESGSLSEAQSKAVDEAIFKIMRLQQASSDCSQVENASTGMERDKNIGAIMSGYGIDRMRFDMILPKFGLTDHVEEAGSCGIDRDQTVRQLSESIVGHDTTSEYNGLYVPWN